jgi:hypothetical protein
MAPGAYPKRLYRHYEKDQHAGNGKGSILAFDIHGNGKSYEVASEKYSIHLKQPIQRLV